VGYTYGEMGDYKKELEYQLKALKIREKVLTPDHPDLATSYNNVGGSYGDLGNHKKELEHTLKALEIWEKVLPSDHPDLATSYSNLGCIYGKMGKWEQSIYYLRKSLVVYENKFPKHDKRTQVVRYLIQEYQKQLQIQQNMAKAGFNFADPFASLIPPKK
jgi:preprotein translocase subunit SecA/nephrocystin-3